MKVKILAAVVLLAATILSACTAEKTSQPQPVQPTKTVPVAASPEPTNTAPVEIPAIIQPTTTSLPQSSAGSISYSNDVQPILDQYCVECHGGKKIKEGLNMSTYEGTIEGSFNGPVLTPGDPANSFMIKQILDGEMPPDRSPKLPKEKFQILVDWITSGAGNN